MSVTLHDTESQDADVPNANNWSIAPENPQNWSLLRKLLSTIVICGIAFTTTLGATTYSQGSDQVKQTFHVSSTIALLPLSAYSLGLAFGPVISSPCSESFGRKAVYLLTVPLFDIFMVAAGLSKNAASLIICRFFAGVFAAPGVSVSAASISDFTTPDQRVAALSAYYSIPFIGSAIGPLIGGFAVDAKGWRWTAWVVLMVAAAFHPPVLFLQESYKIIILKRKAKRSRIDSNTIKMNILSGEKLRNFVTSNVGRPLHMLGTEPLVGLICLYSGFQFALLYTFIVASPWVFSTVYGFSVTEQGLTFIALVCGCIVAPLVLISTDYVLRKGTSTQQHKSFDPEKKLYVSLYGSFVLPIALFWFGWTARPSIHWISPVVAQGTALFGSVIIYIPCNLYMLDVYDSKYRASASGASSFTRYILSAAFPLFVTQMYEALGVGWATSLLGFLALAMAPIPWFFYHFGPRLREKSSYI